MWSYNNELYHYGVLGMKWGRRKGYSNTESSNQVSKRQKEITRKTRGITRDINSFKGYENGIFDKKGRPVLSQEDVKKMVESLTDMKNKQINKINAKYDKKADAITKDIMSFADSKNGINTKNGKVILTKQEVQDIVTGLKKVRDSYL